MTPFSVPFLICVHVLLNNVCKRENSIGEPSILEWNLISGLMKVAPSPCETLFIDRSTIDVHVFTKQTNMMVNFSHLFATIVCIDC